MKLLSLFSVFLFMGVSCTPTLTSSLAEEYQPIQVAHILGESITMKKESIDIQEIFNTYFGTVSEIRHFEVKITSANIYYLTAIGVEGAFPVKMAIELHLKNHKLYVSSHNALQHIVKARYCDDFDFDISEVGSIEGGICTNRYKTNRQIL